MMDVKEKIRILIVNPGPSYDVTAQWGPRLEAMSAWASGCLLGVSPSARQPMYGSFETHMIRSQTGRGISVLLQSLFTILKLRFRSRFDLVVTYDPLKSGLLGWLAALLSRCPLIVEVNGVYTSAYVYEDLSPFKARINKRLLPWVMGFTLRKARGIKLLFDRQIEPFRSRPGRQIIRVFPDIVYTERFKNIEDRKEILCVGFPFFLKGMDLLVDAFKSISDEFPDWKLKLLGWFPNRAQVEAYVGNHPRIEIHPPVLATEVPDHIGRCGIFVLPSRTEAMGRVLVEAMAAGKPRIGSDADGIPTVINDEVDGLLFPAGNSVALAQCLKRLMSDQALRDSLGRESGERAKTEFGVKVYLSAARQFYMEVLTASKV